DLADTWFAVLGALVRHVTQPGAGGRTPSDVALACLAQDEIERLESRYDAIEDILPLSPLQEGLLFVALYEGRGPDVYTVQLALSLEGRLDEAALERAARGVVQRHASLRAGFAHEGLSHAVQVIVPRAQPPWQRIDLTGLDHAARARRWDGLLDADRAARFDLAAPPRLRFALVRLAPDQHRLLVTNHHIVMDGWSVPILLRELLTLYANGGDDGSL